MTVTVETAASESPSAEPSQQGPKLGHAAGWLSPLDHGTFVHLLKQLPFADMLNLLKASKTLARAGGETAQRALDVERTIRQVKSDVLGVCRETPRPFEPFPARPPFGPDPMEQALQAPALRNDWLLAAKVSAWDAAAPLKLGTRADALDALKRAVGVIHGWPPVVREHMCVNLASQLVYNPNMPPEDVLPALDMLLTLLPHPPDMFLEDLAEQLSWIGYSNDKSNLEQIQAFVESVEHASASVRFVAAAGLLLLVDRIGAPPGLPNEAQQSSQFDHLRGRIGAHALALRAENQPADLSPLLDLLRVMVEGHATPAHVPAQRRIALFKVAALLVLPLCRPTGSDEAIAGAVRLLFFDRVLALSDRAERGQALDCLHCLDLLDRPPSEDACVQLHPVCPSQLTAMRWDDPARDLDQNALITQFIHEASGYRDGAASIATLIEVVHNLHDPGADADRSDALRESRKLITEDITRLLANYTGRNPISNRCEAMLGGRLAELLLADPGP